MAMFIHCRAFATTQRGKWTLSCGRRNGCKLQCRTVRPGERPRPSRFSSHLLAVSGAHFHQIYEFTTYRRKNVR
jgi:hypothetical protein